MTARVINPQLVVSRNEKPINFTIHNYLYSAGFRLFHELLVVHPIVLVE
jgi:hypothetical protein